MTDRQGGRHTLTKPAQFVVAAATNHAENPIEKEQAVSTLRLRVIDATRISERRQERRSAVDTDHTKHGQLCVVSRECVFIHPTACRPGASQSRIHDAARHREPCEEGAVAEVRGAPVESKATSDSPGPECDAERPK